MSNDDVIYKPIGIIHSEHNIADKTPIQPVYANGCLGNVELFNEYLDGLKDLEGFSHLYLIYHFHLAGPAKLRVKPFLQDIERGVFATRAPSRPNAIGISMVELVKREGNLLHVAGIDILDGTPLLDIKPYTTRFNQIETIKNGWQDEIDDKTAWKLGRRYVDGKGI